MGYPGRDGGHVVHGAMGCGQKELSVSVAVPPAPVRVPSQRPLAPSIVSVTSVANYKGDNKMIVGAVHRSPGICLTAEENPGNLSKETVDEGCASRHRLKLRSMSGWEKVRIGPVLNSSDPWSYMGCCQKF